VSNLESLFSLSETQRKLGEFRPYTNDCQFLDIDNGTNQPYLPARQNPVPASFPQQTECASSSRANIRNPGNQDYIYPSYAAGNGVSRVTRSSKMEGHSNEISQSLCATYKTSRPFTKQKLHWLLLTVSLVTAWLVWSNGASASCNFVSILASIGSGDGQVLTPRAIAIDPSDNVFVADQNDRVQKFNSSGVFQFKFATGGSSFGSVIAPSGVAVDRTTGDIYVSDGFPERTSGIVQKFNSSGVFQLAWGTAGSGNGQFLNGAGGVAVDSAGNVYVTGPR
jgi:hypothetical protein